MIQDITLIGSGNVAHNLGFALVSEGFRVVQVFSRSLKNAQDLAEKLKATYTNELSQINKKSDLYIVASSDNAIGEIANQLELNDQLVVHTSGSVSAEVLSVSSSNFGSFYPLQTFTRNHQADFSELPICIESNSRKSLELLEEVAKKITNRVINLSSEQRQKLHLAAVFVANFSNYMQAIGQDLCEKQGVDFDLLKPLIKEVFEKNIERRAIDNQTGPALRGDTFTMNRHLEILKQDSQLRELYILISDMIENRKI